VYPSRIILLIEVVLCIFFYFFLINIFFNIKFVIFGSLTLMMIQNANLELTRLTFLFLINFVLLLFYNIRLIFY